MNRKKLEKIRDSLSIGETVEIVKNTWHRPDTIGKVGVIAEEKDQFTPTVRVRFTNNLSHTFSPDDVKKIDVYKCPQCSFFSKVPGKITIHALTKHTKEQIL